MNIPHGMSEVDASDLLNQPGQLEVEQFRY
jgi:hypothetical protein